MTDKLSDNEIQDRLGKLDGWSLKEGKLHRSFDCGDFKNALGFIVRIGLAAEAMDHHPNLFNVYKTVGIDLETHDAGGITEKDFALAQQINDLA